MTGMGPGGGTDMENPGKTYLSADGYLRDIWRLAAAVRRSGWRPDFILGLWRGGAPVAVAVHEFLKVSGWNVQHVPLKCASYSGIGENPGEVEFTHGEIVFGTFGRGSRVLVVDDVFDTGKTAAAVKGRLDALEADSRFACVYWKPEKNVTSLKPDYFAADAGGRWIVFPHEMDGLSQEELVRKDPELAQLLSSASSI
jgi:hypoxanthine phosphoribosyltransferase